MASMKTLENRFWSKVDYDTRDYDRCWPWTASSDDGYGKFGFADINGVVCMTRSHRLAYELENGEIPEGYVVDHTCHDPKTCAGGSECEHRRCCNPDHMQLVSAAVNNAADRAASRGRKQTHCKRGHEFTAENIYRTSHGSRECRACKRLHRRGLL